MKYKYNEQWVNLSIKALDSMEVGCIIQFMGSTIPNGWLECNGASISQSTYPELYNLIGGTLPDFRGRVLVGQDTTQTEFDTLGETGGSKYLQEHNHSVEGGDFVTANTSSISAYGSVTASGYLMSFKNKTENAGTGDSGNLQPYAVVKHIIKAVNTTPTMASIVDGHSTSTQDGYSANYVNNNFQLKGTILYQNNSGATGNITLNDAIENYKYYEIIPYGSEYQATKNRVGTNSIISRFAYDGTYIYSATETISLSGTSLTKSGIAGWYGTTSNPYQNQSTSDWYSIYQVIGYK